MNRRWFLTLLVLLGISAPGAWAQQIDPELPRDLDGIWWQPADAGWATAMFDHAAAMSSVLMIYDDVGRPTWLVAPRLDCYRNIPEWAIDNCTGPMYRVMGTWFGASTYRTSDLSVKEVGYWTGTFFYPLYGGNGPDTRRFMYLEYGLDGQVVLGNGARPLRVQVIDPNDDFLRADGRYSGLWGIPEENGWGVGIFAQNKSLVATLFVFGPDKQPRWYVILANISPYDTRPDAHFDGGIYETKGYPLGRSIGLAGSASVRQVGAASLHFGTQPGDTATLTYSIDGVEVSKTISRAP